MLSMFDVFNLFSNTKNWSISELSNPWPQNIFLLCVLRTVPKAHLHYLTLSHSEMHCIFLNVKIIQMCPLYLETLSLMWCVYHRLLLWPELHVSYSGRREGGKFPFLQFYNFHLSTWGKCKVETLQHNKTLPTRLQQISTHHWLHAPWNNLNIHFYSSPPRNIKGAGAGDRVRIIY